MIHPDLRVDLSEPAVVAAVLRDVLCLDDDLTMLHEGCDRALALAARAEQVER